MFRHFVRRLRPFQALGIFVFLNVFSTAALACPLCRTDTGKQVRAGIFGPDFTFNMVVTIIPFVIFLGITALIYFGLPTRGNRSDAHERNAFSSGAYPEGENL